MSAYEVVSAEMAGYSTPAYSWRCPMCILVFVGPNLSSSYVMMLAETHLMRDHNIPRELIEFEVVPEHKPERDPRWQRIEAHISAPQGYFYEDENLQFNPLDLVEFQIEVWWGDQCFYSKIIVHKNDLEEKRLRTYQWTLDKMCEQIDMYMDMSLKGTLDGDHDRPAHIAGQDLP